MQKFIDGQDAVFLPGKIHGCDWQIYILYYNSCANNHKGCWEIEILDTDRVLALYESVNGEADAFFDLLPDCFQGEWQYCNFGTDAFNEYARVYSSADFTSVGIVGIGTLTSTSTKCTFLWFAWKA